ARQREEAGALRFGEGGGGPARDEFEGLNVFVRNEIGGDSGGGEADTFFIDLDRLTGDSVARHQAERAGAAGHLWGASRRRDAKRGGDRAPEDAAAGARLLFVCLAFLGRRGRLAVDDAARDIRAKRARGFAPAWFPHDAAGTSG